MPYLKGICSSFPKYKVSQKDILDLSRQVFRKRKDFGRMEKVFKNSGVNNRYLVKSLDWYKDNHSWAERSSLFKKNSLILLKKCINKTLKAADIKSSEIGAIVVINTTGIATPSLDAEILNHFNFKNTTKRLPIFGYGCSGGVLGINRATEIYDSIKQPVLVCNIELCSLTFKPKNFSKANIVSTALFGDGAASYIVDGEGDCEVKRSLDYTWRNTLDLMGWDVEDDGLKVIFDKVIPDFIFRNLPLIVKEFSSSKPDGYILHSGGMKIIDAYKQIFNNHGTISFSEEILSKFGNVSSVSVLLVLEMIIKKKLNGIFLMSALGPGFTAGLVEVSI